MCAMRQIIRAYTRLTLVKPRQRGAPADGNSCTVVTNRMVVLFILLSNLLVYHLVIRSLTNAVQLRKAATPASPVKVRLYKTVLTK